MSHQELRAVYSSLSIATGTSASGTEAYYSALSEVAWSSRSHTARFSASVSVASTSLSQPLVPTTFIYPKYSDKQYERMISIDQGLSDGFQSLELGIDPVNFGSSPGLEDPIGYLDKHLPHLNLTGQTLYKRRQAADGGYSTIHRATLWAREVAIKVAFHRKQKYPSATLRAVVKEMALWAQLEHKNICPLIGYRVENDKSISIVMPWQANGTARDFVATRSQAVRIKVIMGACLGLRYLHSRKVVHGDFKGDNVLVDSKGSAVVSDFGLSRSLSPVSKSSDSSGNIGGNVRYMAPELFLPGNSAVHTERSDIWACGVTVLELFWNITPYALIPPIQIPLTVTCGMKPFHPLPHHEGIWSICNKCWVKDPFARINMATLVQDLRLAAQPVRESSIRASTVQENISEIEDSLSKGALVSTADEAALRAACAAGIPETVRLLIDSGVDANRLLTDGASAYSHARTLIKATGARLGLSTGFIPKHKILSTAYRHGGIDLVKLCLKLGVEVEPDDWLCFERDQPGDYPGILNAVFFAACMFGRSETVEMILKTGYNANTGNGHALRLACASGHLNVANLLIERGANVNLLLDIDPGGPAPRTALHAACWEGNIEIIKLLLRSGARVEAKTSYRVKWGESSDIEGLINDAIVEQISGDVDRWLESGKKGKALHRQDAGRIQSDTKCYVAAEYEYTAPTSVTACSTV